MLSHRGCIKEVIGSLLIRDLKEYGLDETRKAFPDYEWQILQVLHTKIIRDNWVVDKSDGTSLKRIKNI